jgi:hypothetical protein
MDDLLMLASELAENNNYKTADNTYEEKKPDGLYSVLIESIKLRTSESTGTQWFNIVAKVLEGDYVEEKFYVSYFLTEKTVKRTLAKLMKLINSCGYDIDVAMFNDVDTIEEGLQELVGSNLFLDKKTSKKGFVDYSFMNEEELSENEEEED